jgi:hypothetical protein
VDNLLALLSGGILAIHIELSSMSMVLAVRLNVFDHLGHAEQVVHAFERHALGLGDEEPNEEEHGEAEAAVDEESAGRC